MDSQNNGHFSFDEIRYITPKIECKEGEFWQNKHLDTDQEEFSLNGFDEMDEGDMKNTFPRMTFHFHGRPLAKQKIYFYELKHMREYWVYMRKIYNHRRFIL